MAESPTITYRLECSAFPSTPLLVGRMSLQEALTQPYEALLDVALHDDSADPTELLGNDAILTLRRGELERRLCGVVARVEETRDPGRAPMARLWIQPALSLSKHRVNTRMFQNLAVPEILETVLPEMLDPYGRDAQLDLEATYHPREYCLQYQESDLHFVQRLLEEEGIAYAFDHEGDVEVLRLTDRNGAFEPIASLAGDGMARFVPHARELDEAEPVHRFDLRMQQTTTTVTVGDFDWTHAGYVVQESAEGEDELGHTRESYEHGEGRSLQIGSYDEGVRRYQKNDAAHQASVRREAAAVEGRTGHGIGRIVGMAPGRRFTLDGHPSVLADGDYLITRVWHVSEPVDAALGSDHAQGAELYHNRFECIPLDTTYRPSRTVAKPRIHGIQPALVTGPSGEEIHVDEHGRIKVQFHWDRENPADETSSCWIRVKQEWAGPSWGFWWVPRIGMEVVVHFLDGDPDRPLVTGAVYDGANPTPYPLPDEKTKSTIKSNSSLGGEGFNELRFEDAAGEEEIFTHAQKDYNEVVENDHNTLVHHDQTNTVDHDQRQTVDANQQERVDVDQTMTVGGNRTVHVKGDYDETVDGTETRTVSGDVSETFGSNEDRTVSGSVTESVGADETRDVGANLSETIGASHERTVSGNEDLTVSGSLTRTGTAGINTTTPAAHDVTVAGAWNVTAPAGIQITAPGGVTLSIPGGVSRSDFKWEVTFMASQSDRGVLDTEVVVSKVGVAAIQTGCWIVKLDFHASEKKASGADLYQGGVNLKNRAIDKILDALSVDFEGIEIAL
ncbi:MAG TPA: type VI secretion system tip protein TssI/VgrG [Sandaracinaceae bacterium LLY-WYZ-13_1]|nr:type VI secretion system tip protein TssI/VgrG [Sandaracinaceae bacterium LLY-WYZ-13_1]